MTQERLPILPDGSIDFGNGVIGPSKADVEFFNSSPLRLPINSTAHAVVSEQSRVEPRRSRIPRAFRGPLYVAMSVAGIGFVVACGGGEEHEVKAAGDENVATPVVTLVTPGSADTGSATPEIRPPATGGGLGIEPTATATATATPEVTTPKLEVVPMEQLPEKLDNIMASIDSLTASFGGRETPDFFQGSKREMRRKVESTKEALAKGDIEAARQNLLEVKKDIIRVGNPLQSKFVPKELKERHDPRDKYIQFDSVDPQVFEWYFGVIDIFRSTDPSY